MKDRKKERSEAFINFYNHVFGHYAYYVYNGLAEYIFSDLNQSEREQARELVIQAFKSNSEEERKIEAAGYLKIKELEPKLEALFKSDKCKNDSDLRSLVFAALVRIDFENADKDFLLGALLGNQDSSNLSKQDAAKLLIGFGKDPKVIEALLNTIIDTHSDHNYSSLHWSARYALWNIFKNNNEICDALNTYMRSSDKDKDDKLRLVVSLIKKEISP
jgi:hypothetical protein